ncbi:hypothetical protein PCA20602_01279 [Pandoraea capi]|uniref:Glycerophosphoryl diester phosphodiesterase membrane domain-containing protein n=1 Tax=Pandoraea capi TaxID=2508286 RepID=A0ABY6VSQ3_9BURK|nr:hypothetical protein [Pandoraea capi]VVD84055.1 hypothetical protein PCA20602_01279 [Pandoraea capi]
MEPITFKQCFKGAWIDGFNALRSRPLLCVSVAVVILVSSALGISLKQLSQAAAQNGDTAGYRFNLALTSLGVAFVNTVAVAILSVHVLRYVVLGPEAARQAPWMGRDVWRYLWLTLQIVIGGVIVGFVPAFLIGLALGLAKSTNALALMATFLVLVACAVIFIGVRVSLIYGQIAAGRSKRWRAAWQDSRGHFWSMFGTALAAILPLFAVGLVLTLLLGLTIKLMPDVTVAVLGSLMLKTVFTVVWVAVGCGVAGWLYHRYAHQLLDLEGAPDDV